MNILLNMLLTIGIIILGLIGLLTIIVLIIMIITVIQGISEKENENGK